MENFAELSVADDILEYLLDDGLQNRAVTADVADDENPSEENHCPGWCDPLPRLPAKLDFVGEKP